jgi:manganese transport protein
MNEAMSQLVVPHTLTEQTCFHVREALAGRPRGARAMVSFAGPAVVTSIAYMDPGNFATNLQAGAGYGYTLLWVVAVANIVAMLFQSLSAKLGLVTGRNLAELCRESLPSRYVYAMWGMSEIAAMATDLAEFVGGAIGVSLLLHLPMMASMLVTGAVTYGLLQFERKGFRPLELVIAALVGVIGLSYLAELLIAPVHPDIASIETAWHTLTPLLGSAAAGLFLAALIASGISSSVVGTMAGQMIMQGFVGFRIPVWLRRLVTMVPAFVVVAWGVDATSALVLSQVVLSIALPAPMIALVWFTSRSALMGRYRNSRLTTVTAVAGTVAVLTLNLFLLLQITGGCH